MKGIHKGGGDLLGARKTEISIPVVEKMGSIVELGMVYLLFSLGCGTA
jgi:hypothetical protein